MGVPAVFSTTFCYISIDYIFSRRRFGRNSNSLQDQILFFVLYEFLIFLLCSVQLDFLNKRQSSWEDAFRSLYYMLRKSVCDIFYGNYHHSSFCNLFIKSIVRILDKAKRIHKIYICGMYSSLRTYIAES